MAGATKDGHARADATRGGLLQFLERNGFAVPTELVDAYTQQQKAYPTSTSTPSRPDRPHEADQGADRAEDYRRPQPTPPIHNHRQFTGQSVAPQPESLAPQPQAPAPQPEAKEPVSSLPYPNTKPTGDYRDKAVARKAARPDSGHRDFPRQPAAPQPRALAPQPQLWAP